MNEPNNMYRMRPIIELVKEIDLPKSMYKMKVIQNSYYKEQSEPFTNALMPSKEQKPTPEVIALENQQEAILVQLAQLKQQLHNLRQQLKQPLVSVNSGLPKNALLEEIVVKANPKWPPYSLLAFNCLLQNSIYIHSYVHSTVSTDTDILEHFNKTSDSPLFSIRLIWKDVPDTEFLTSPTKHTVIAAEVNLLRFLSRMGPIEFSYETSNNPVVATVVDELLDLCYQLVKENAKVRHIHLRAFDVVLEKYKSLMGEKISVVDIAGWSALKQIGCLSNDLPASLNEWFEKCNKMFEVNVSI